MGGRDLYGVVRWVGTLAPLIEITPNSDLDLTAGIELVSVCSASVFVWTDGMSFWVRTNHYW